MIVAMMIVTVVRSPGRVLPLQALAVSISYKPRGLYRNTQPRLRPMLPRLKVVGSERQRSWRSPATAGFLFHRRC